MIFDILKMQKPIKLDCFISESDIFHSEPIDKAEKFLPDWWKKLPGSYLDQNQFIETPTIKGCPGLVDYFKYGFMIPLWSDLKIYIGNNELAESQWQFADNRSNMVIHDKKQRGDFLTDKTTHFKIVSPWRIVCSESLPWICSIPTWSQSKSIDFFGVTGVINFFYNHDTNINFFVQHNTTDRIINIEKGLPMFHCIPLTQRPIQIRTHLVDAKDMYKKAPLYYRGSFTNRYRKYVAKFQKKNKE